MCSESHFNGRKSPWTRETKNTSNTVSKSFTNRCGKENTLSLLLTVKTLFQGSSGHANNNHISVSDLLRELKKAFEYRPMTYRETSRTSELNVNSAYQRLKSIFLLFRAKMY